MGDARMSRKWAVICHRACEITGNTNEHWLCLSTSIDHEWCDVISRGNQFLVVLYQQTTATVIHRIEVSKLDYAQTTGEIAS